MESNNNGFGQTKSADASEYIQVSIQVRPDSQIPEFDAISEYKYHAVGFANLQKYHDKVAEMVNEAGGMFIDDALKLEPQDVFSMLGEEIHPKDTFAIPALKALKKAILDYFRKTNQQARILKVTENIVCNCRHISNHEIEDVVKKGHTALEEVKQITGAGLGCSSCSGKIQEVIDNVGKIKTAFGGF
ncbi:MAG: (2Fe-2S)-binding protein [Patescibacteria group bacterium]